MDHDAEHPGDNAHVPIEAIELHGLISQNVFIQ
jgi:hypothetical protein